MTDVSLEDANGVDIGVTAFCTMDGRIPVGSMIGTIIAGNQAVHQATNSIEPIIICGTCLERIVA